jgi:hypothetical protein
MTAFIASFECDDCENREVSCSFVNPRIQDAWKSQLNDSSITT